MHRSESLADDRVQREPHRWSRAECERMAEVGVLDLRQDRRRPPARRVGCGDPSRRPAAIDSTGAGIRRRSIERPLLL
jgi:hypothetical protein